MQCTPLTGITNARKMVIPFTWFLLYWPLDNGDCTKYILCSRCSPWDCKPSINCISDATKWDLMAVGMHHFKWSFSFLLTLALQSNNISLLLYVLYQWLFVSSLDQNVILGIIRFKLCVTKRYGRPKWPRSFCEKNPSIQNQPHGESDEVSSQGGVSSVQPLSRLSEPTMAS
jgi:hypothetical protein